MKKEFLTGYHSQGTAEGQQTQELSASVNEALPSELWPEGQASKWTHT